MSQGLILLENILQVLYTGIVVGSVYGLMCVGLALIFSVMRVVNFAQGEFLMLGMYGSLIIFSQLGLGVALGPYLGPLVANVISAVVVFFIGCALYELLLSRITGLRAAGTEGEGHYAQLTLDARAFAHPAERRADRVRLYTRIDQHAAVGECVGAGPSSAVSRCF